MFAVQWKGTGFIGGIFGRKDRRTDLRRGMHETLERLVMGDLSGCGVLVALHPDSIPDKHAETAERIRAAVGDRFAAR